MNSLFPSGKVDWMLLILVVAGAMVLISFWKAHRKPGFAFDLFDLIMEKGKVSKFALVFMVTFAVSTWMIIDRELKGTLTEGLFGMYGAMWIAPIVARMLADSKGESSGSTTTTKVETTEKVVT